MHTKIDGFDHMRLHQFAKASCVRSEHSTTVLSRLLIAVLRTFCFEISRSRCRNDFPTSFAGDCDCIRAKSHSRRHINKLFVNFSCIFLCYSKWPVRWECDTVICTMRNYALFNATEVVKAWLPSPSSRCTNGFVFHQKYWIKLAQPRNELEIQLQKHFRDVFSLRTSLDVWKLDSSSWD